MPDVKTLPEQYGTTVVSSNLRIATDRVSAGDSMLAVAMASADMRLGSLLWRLHVANDAGAYAPAMAIIRSRARRWSQRKKWSQHEARHCDQIAKMALDWWVWGICARCTGTGRERVDGARNVLSDDHCESCRGAGRTPLERQVPARLLDRCRDVVGILDNASTDLQRRAGQRLRDTG